MEFFNTFAIAPDAGYLDLLRYLLVIALSISIPYIGVVLVATSISMVLNWRDQDRPNRNFARMAKQLMDMVVPNSVVPLALAILPLLALWFIYGQWLYQAQVPSMVLFPIGAALIALSFGPIIAYRSMLYPDGRNTLISLLVGKAGAVALMLGTMLLFTAIVRFNDPERWHLEQNPFRLLLSFNVIWRHAVFILASAGLTGIALVFFSFHRPGSKKIEDAGYAKFVKNFGAVMAIICAIKIPIVWFFYMVTTPIIAYGPSFYQLSVVMAGVLFVVFVLMYRTVIAEQSRHGVAALNLFLLVFVLISVLDQVVLANATREHTAMLVAEADARKAQDDMEREAAMEGTVVADVATGERVYNELCMTCHRMDERLVGPPLNTVLPKYGTPDALAAFVRNPVKVNPEYPPMPAPALSLQEIKSVALYLLGGDDATPADGQETPADGGGH